MVIGDDPGQPDFRFNKLGDGYMVIMRVMILVKVLPLLVIRRIKINERLLGQRWKNPFDKVDSV
jgi:hypothetical protein